MTRQALTVFLRRPLVIGGVLGAVLIILIWFLAFFTPEGHKLSSVKAEELSLHQTVAQDQAKVAQLAQVKSKYATIKAEDTRLSNYTPSTADIYTYITTLSKAAQSSGVTISAISPSSPAPVPSEPFNGVPIQVSCTGTYDALLKLIKNIYQLPRLTDINALSFGGGGPKSTRKATLTLSLSLEVFYKVAPAPATTTTTTPKSTTL